MKTLKNLLMGSLILFGSSFAVDGFSVYKKYCSTCHLAEVSMKRMQEIENSINLGKQPLIKAPPFPEVSARIKYFYPDKEDFVKFVVDYITNPSAKKAKCLPMALKKFGVMPPIGKSMTQEEKVAIASWLYDNYNTRWEDMPMGKMKMQGKACNMHRNMEK